MEVSVCLGQNCINEGKLLAKNMKDAEIIFSVSTCRSLCTYAPIVFIDAKAKLKATLDDIEQALRK